MQVRHDMQISRLCFATVPETARESLLSNTEALPAAARAWADAFVQVFGRMGQTAHEYALGGKINGPQFHVCFQKIAVGVDGQFVQLSRSASVEG